MKPVSNDKRNIANSINASASPDTFIDVRTLTLRQLRSKLEPTENRSAYEASWFREHPEMIFCIIPDGDATLTVYKNRFYTYKKCGYTCVIHIDFKNIEYDRKKLFTDIDDISEEEFLDKPFLGTLSKEMAIKRAKLCTRSILWKFQQWLCLNLLTQFRGTIIFVFRKM